MGSQRSLRKSLEVSFGRGYSLTEVTDDVDRKAYVVDGRQVFLRYTNFEGTVGVHASYSKGFSPSSLVRRAVRIACRHSSRALDSKGFIVHGIGRVRISEGLVGSIDDFVGVETEYNVKLSFVDYEFKE